MNTKVLKQSTGFFKSHFDLLVLIITIIGVLVWVRTESRSDYRALESKFDILTKEIHDWNMNFQGRLCAIEERRKEK